MSVYDRWHKSRPAAGEAKCKDHKKAPSAVHGQGMRWQVRGRDDKGMPYKENFSRQADAEAKDAELKTAVRAGTYVNREAGKVTFRAYAEEWRAARTHDPETARRIGSEFRNHVYGAAGGRARTPKGGIPIGDCELRVLAARPTLVQQWIKGLPGAAGTRLLIIRDVSQVFRAAVEDGKINRNPLKSASIQKPKADRSKAAAWTREQIVAVADELPERLQAMAYLAAACGHRQGELFAVAVEDLNLMRKTCHVEMQVKIVGGRFAFAATKNQSIRDIPLAAPVVPLLSEHIRLFPPVPVTLPRMELDGSLGRPVTRLLVFTRPDGQAYYRGVVNPVWRRAWRSAGIAEAGQVNGMHVLRHTAASAWLSAGLSLAKAAAYLGDTKEVVLKTYAHFMPDDDDRARVIMDAFFSAPAEGQSALISPSGSPG